MDDNKSEQATEWEWDLKWDLEAALSGYKHAVSTHFPGIDEDYIDLGEPYFIGELSEFRQLGWFMTAEIRMTPWMFGYFFWRARNGLVTQEVYGVVGELLDMASHFSPDLEEWRVLAA